MLPIREDHRDHGIGGICSVGSIFPANIIEAEKLFPFPILRSPARIIEFQNSQFLDLIILLSDNYCMKITVELSDSDLVDICRMTGEKKKGPAIRQMVVDALMMKRREEIARKFITGKLGAELSGFEAARAADRKAAKTRGFKWRGSCQSSSASRLSLAV